MNYLHWYYTCITCVCICDSHYSVYRYLLTLSLMDLYLLYYPDLLLFQETMGKVYHIWILWWRFIYIFKSSNVLLTECAVVLFLNLYAMIFFLSTLPSFFNNFSVSLYMLFCHCQAFFLYWRAEIILKISLDIILKPGHLLQRMWINHHFDFPRTVLLPFPYSLNYSSPLFSCVPSLIIILI